MWRQVSIGVAAGAASPAAMHDDRIADREAGRGQLGIGAGGVDPAGDLVTEDHGKIDP